MDKQKRNPKSKSPSPLPSWMEDEALSGQWEGPVGESDLPLSQTEEGTFLDMDKHWNDDTDQELSRSGIVTRSQDVTLQELYRWEEEVRVRERSQQRDRRQRELYQREEKVRVRELSQEAFSEEENFWKCCDEMETAQQYKREVTNEETEEAFSEDEDFWKWCDEMEIAQQYQRDVSGYQEESEEEDDIGPELPEEKVQRHSKQIPSEGSQALLDTEQHKSSEILSQAELELRRSIQQLQAQRELEQSRAAEMVTTVPEEKEESPVPAPQGPSVGSQALLDFTELITTEDHKEDSNQEEQSEGKGGRSPQVRSSYESFSQEEESPGHFSSYQDLLSSWENSLGQDFSPEDGSIGQEFSSWEEDRGSVQFRWEDGSERERALQDWQQRVTVHTIEVKPFRREDDEWEELSVLELPQAGEREQRLSVPTSRQAWAERRVSHPCTPVPGCASPPQLQPQAPRGDVAAPKKRPSRLRRALRALGRLFRSCLVGQPED